MIVGTGTGEIFKGKERGALNNECEEPCYMADKPLKWHNLLLSVSRHKDRDEGSKKTRKCFNQWHFFFLNLNFSSVWNYTGTIWYKELCIVTKTVLTSRNKTNFMPIKAQGLAITTLPVYLAYIINLICIHWVNCAYGNTVCHAEIVQSLIAWLELFLI